MLKKILAALVSFGKGKVWRKTRLPTQYFSKIVIKNGKKIKTPKQQ